MIYRLTVFTAALLRLLSAHLTDGCVLGVIGYAIILTYARYATDAVYGREMIGASAPLVGFGSPVLRISDHIGSAKIFTFSFC